MALYLADVAKRLEALEQAFQRLRHVPVTNRSGTAETHAHSNVTTGGTVAYSALTGKPTLGTAAALDVPAAGNAASGQVVKGSDTRLSDTRTPTSHNHAATDINSSTLDGDRLPALSATKKGGAPATGTPTGKYLKDDGTWDTPAAASVAPNDAEYVVETANGDLSNEVVLGTTVITTAAHASRPAAAKAGRIFLPSDSHYVARDTGAAWGVWGPVFKLTEPVDGDFAWINQETASVVTTYGGVYLLAPADADLNFRVRKKAAPSVPYTITAYVRLNAINLNYIQGGLLFRQSSDGKMSYLGISFATAGTSLSVGKMTNETTYSAAYTTVACQMAAGGLWLRIADNNTNRICSMSVDGQNWQTLHSVGRTNFLTADEVGFYANSSNATNDAGLLLMSWAEG